MEYGGVKTTTNIALKLKRGLLVYIEYPWQHIFITSCKGVFWENNLLKDSCIS